MVAAHPEKDAPPLLSINKPGQRGTVYGSNRLAICFSAKNRSRLIATLTASDETPNSFYSLSRRVLASIVVCTLDRVVASSLDVNHLLNAVVRTWSLDDCGLSGRLDPTGTCRCHSAKADVCGSNHDWLGLGYALLPIWRRDTHHGGQPWHACNPAVMVRREPQVHMLTMMLGAVSWVVGNFLPVRENGVLAHVPTS